LLFCWIFYICVNQQINYMIVQRLKKEAVNGVSIAEKYYSILSVLNDMGLTSRDIQLVAFTAINGNIASRDNKQIFCMEYDTTMATVNNIVSKMRRLGLFVKKDKMIQVNPLVNLDFQKGLNLDIKLVYAEK